MNQASELKLLVEKAHRNSLKSGYQLHWYEIIRILGQGSFGITYLAQDLNLEKPVAIKEYLPIELSVRDGDASVHPVSDQHSDRYAWGLERFIAEARTLGKFNHPNIVRVLSVFEANNTAYMVMTYEEGESFDKVLAERKTLSEGELKAIVLPILDGLEDVHEAGFIHRDIKPANIFIRQDGSPVLLDFGSARQALGGPTQTLTTVVSPGYAPFEQYSSKSGKQGPWTDIYGLGATLYRAVIGAPPMSAIDRSQGILKGSHDTLVRATEGGQGRYSKSFLKAIDHAIRFNEPDRPQSVSEWAAELKGKVEVIESTGKVERSSSSDPLPRIVNENGRISAAAVPSLLHEPRAKPVPWSSTRWAWKLGPCMLLFVAAGLGWHYQDRITKFVSVDVAPLRSESERPLAENKGLTHMVQGQDEQVAAAAEQPVPDDQQVVTGDTRVATDPEFQRSNDELSKRHEEQRLRDDKINTLLQQAQQDLDASRLTEPKADNALKKYHAVLAIDGQNQDAQEGIHQILKRYLALAEESIEAGRYDQAEEYIAGARVVDPEAHGITALQEQLAVHRAEAAESAEFLRLLSRARAAFEAGRLTEPPGDNAAGLYRQAQQLRPGSGAVEQGLIDVGNRLLELANESSYNGNYQQAETYLDQAEALLPDRPEIESARWYVAERKAARERAAARKKRYGF